LKVVGGGEGVVCADRLQCDPLDCVRLLALFCSRYSAYVVISRKMNGVMKYQTLYERRKSEVKKTGKKKGLSFVELFLLLS
jgi:hypothetical protein